jgi:hypothetical protein
MLDSIIKLVKSEAFSAITNTSEVPAEKQNEVVEKTSSTIIDGLKSQLSFKNIGAITNLFKDEDSVPSNPIVKNIQGTVTDALAQKVGLDKGIASTVSSTVVPAIFKLISERVNDPDDSEFDIQSLVSSIAGGKAGGIFSFIKGLFSK